MQYSTNIYSKYVIFYLDWEASERPAVQHCTHQTPILESCTDWCIKEQKCARMFVPQAPAALGQDTLLPLTGTLGIDFQ